MRYDLFLFQYKIRVNHERHNSIFGITNLKLMENIIITIMAHLQLQNLSFQIKKIKQNLQAGLPLKYTYQQLQEQQLKCAGYLEDMSNNNNYKHFAEVASIQEKYRLMKEAVKKARVQNMGQKQLNNLIKKILLQDVEILPKDINNLQEQNFDIKSSDVYVPQSSQTIDAFFKKKDNQLAKKQTSFKRILNSQEFNFGNQTISNKSVSKNSRFSKSHLKRDEEKQTRLKNVIEEHKKAINNLQKKIKQDEQLNEFEKNLLRQQKNRYIQKMQQLEQQIQQLYRDNYRLKQLQKTAKVHDSFNNSQLKEKDSLANAYEPYVIKTRVNDLNKINQKNQLKLQAKQKQQQKLKQKLPQYELQPDFLGDKLQKEKVFTAKQFFNKKPTNYGLFDEKFQNKKNQSNNMILKDLLGDSFEHGKSPIIKASPSNNFSIGSIGNGNHFDTFQLAQTLPYINDSILGESRNIVNMTKEVSTRNKVAFFKNSLVLIRNQQIEIAFKRSDLNQKMDKIRLIFYINNKTNRTRRVNFSYEYQIDYFNIKVQQKITQVAPRSQGREAIMIDLISRADLNGVSDVHIQVDEIIYDLWLPINFIRFKHAANYRMPKDTLEMTVLPDRQFSSFSEVQKIAPIMFGGQDSSEIWAYLYGQSKFGNYPIKLTWRQKDLIIETTQKWLDFIGFVLHFFK